MSHNSVSFAYITIAFVDLANDGTADASMSTVFDCAVDNGHKQTRARALLNHKPKTKWYLNVKKKQLQNVDSLLSLILFIYIMILVLFLFIYFYFPDAENSNLFAIQKRIGYLLHLVESRLQKWVVIYFFSFLFC